MGYMARYGAAASTGLLWHIESGGEERCWIDDGGGWMNIVEKAKEESCTLHLKMIN